MDIRKALCQLHDEKKRLDATIAALEARIAAPTGKGVRSHPGRKSVSPQARSQVSRRTQTQQLTPED